MKRFTIVLKHNLQVQLRCEDQEYVDRLISDSKFGFVRISSSMVANVNSHEFGVNVNLHKLSTIQFRSEDIVMILEEDM
jgi:hypothetical protein